MAKVSGRLCGEYQGKPTQTPQLARLALKRVDLVERTTIRAGMKLLLAAFRHSVQSECPSKGKQNALGEELR